METIKVLLIDADDANRNFLAQMLQKKNYQVVQASTGAEGVRLLETENLNLIVFDTKLPDIQAVDLLEMFQQSPTVADVPCVVLSSKSDPEEMQACLAAGCAEYYIKSGMVMMTLVDAIPKLLVDGKRMRKQQKQGFLFVFLSGKGGTGTSSLCANIGMSVVNQFPQSSVAVADLVLPMGSIASIVGANEEKINLISVANQSEESITADFMKEQLEIPQHWLFHLLPGAPSPESAVDLQAGHIPNIIRTLRNSFDYVFVDIGRSLSKISLPIIQEADLVVLILSTDLSTVNHTQKLWHYLKAQGISPERVYPILNRAVGLEGLTKVEAEKILGLEIKLMVPYMMGNFTLANNQHTPVIVKFPTDTAGMVFKQAALDMSKLAIKLQA